MEPVLRRMNDDQRQRWERDGYFIIKGALNADEVVAFSEELDALDVLSQRHGREPGSYLDVVNIVDRPTDRSNGMKDLGLKPNRFFIDLLDHHSHLGIVCEVMGAAIHVLGTQVMIRPPNAKPTNRWHRDTVAPYGFPAVNGQLPLQQFRIGWFLSDMPEPDMGNLCIIPGSHLEGFPAIPSGLDHAMRVTSFSRYQELENICDGVPGACQITLNAGDAVVFHNSLFHAVARNTSSISRKNLYYVYGPWWARLNDRMTVSSEAVALCCPVKQQLIGATLEPGACGGTPPDKRMPLIQFFEGQGFQEVFDSEVAEYIRTTQMEMKSDSEWR